MAQAIPAGTRVRILPPSNAAGNIIPDNYQLAGKLGSVVKQTGASSILIMRDYMSPARAASTGAGFTFGRLVSGFAQNSSSFGTR
jgi:hypothetical protein